MLTHFLFLIPDFSKNLSGSLFVCRCLIFKVHPGPPASLFMPHLPYTLFLGRSNILPHTFPLVNTFFAVFLNFFQPKMRRLSRRTKKFLFLQKNCIKLPFGESFRNAERHNTGNYRRHAGVLRGFQLLLYKYTREYDRNDAV